MKKHIHLNHITKIEGHASLHIGLKNGKIEKCELSSIEGARYFEQILEGRDYTEAFEVSSRICGICSCAHTICSITAIENALDLKVSTQTRILRELLTLAERIRSHATHLYFLALPDYLGYESAMAMVPKYKKEIQRALRMMKVGNHMVKVIGGRDLHPVAAHVGGFSSIPSKEELLEIQEQIASIKPDAIKTAKLFMKLKTIPFERHIESYCVSHKKEYGMLRGDIVSGDTSFKQERFFKEIDESHRRYSTAKFIKHDDKEYRVGAISRFNNNAAFLSDDAKKLLKKSRIELPSQNPFHNNVCQAIEIVHSLDHVVQILEDFSPKKEVIKKAKIKAGKGVAAIEVPRGILWHAYELDKKGKITKANIMTPTTQNIFAIQEDIRAYLPSLMHLKKDEIVLEIEKLIRSYDPCFSCSTHFLEVKWEEE